MRARILGSTSESGACRSVMQSPSLVPHPPSPSFVDFLHSPLMAATFEPSFQPLVQDVDPLLLTPCQRRPYSGEAVGRIRHAQTCTTSEHSALHFSTADGARDGLGIVGIVVRRVELLRPDVDWLVPE